MANPKSLLPTSCPRSSTRRPTGAVMHRGRTVSLGCSRSRKTPMPWQNSSSRCLASRYPYPTTGCALLGSPPMLRSLFIWTRYSRAREQGYIRVKALLHLAIQRKCIDNRSDAAVFESISGLYPTTGLACYEGDSNLGCIFAILNRNSGNDQTNTLEGLLVHDERPHLDGPHPSLPCLGCPQERWTIARLY